MRSAQDAAVRGGDGKTENTKYLKGSHFLQKPGLTRMALR
jgi:hypothetical protein